MMPVRFDLLSGLTLSLAVLLAAGTASRGHAAEGDRAAATARHWAFQPLPANPRSRTDTIRPSANTIDYWVIQGLRPVGLELGVEAKRSTLIRRVAFLATGLPPTPHEIAAFVADRNPDAYDRMVERYLASPRMGERWGKHWLDAAGYADSNGYFNADTDRPLAYRYRDYVIRSLNRDLPFDQFVREQLAGDELAGWKPGEPVNPAIIELLEATHFLRNGQDGSGESDGNPDEVRTDRYYALESAMQIIGSSLLGLTVQCAKCHDHKFESITQRDYYSLQAVLYPAFHIEKWVKPNDRVVDAQSPGELEKWQAGEKVLDEEQAGVRREYTAWVTAHRPKGRVLFDDTFDAPGGLAARWSNTAPGDNAPGGTPPVTVDGEASPAARIQAGALQIVEGGGSGDRWISTRSAFDWQPAEKDEWIQVTFDLVALRLGDTGTPAQRVGYFLATHDFSDHSSIPGGNVLIDGNPGGPSAVQVDYPGTDAQVRGNIGTIGYQPGHNFGARITRRGTNDFLLEHLVEGVPEGPSIQLKAADLPRGGFGFEYCCGRSFVVDNVRVEASSEAGTEGAVAEAQYRPEAARRKTEFDAALKAIAVRRDPKPGRIAWMTDSGPIPPEVHLLKRGNHQTPGEVVPAAVPAFLRSKAAGESPLATTATRTSTGRRLAWARWLTEPGSAQAGLLARVTVNRIWQQYFGVGLVATPDNFGLSGARPTHAELLDALAAELVQSGWSLKAVHRRILQSATFRQTSEPRSSALAQDPANRLLWRFPVHRLDAEAIRDALLAVADRQDAKSGGPYVPTPRTGTGEIVVDEAKPEAFARTVFLQQRRTQVPTFLGNFDAPSLVFNCTRRAETTMPLQSLSLLNSEFAVRRGEDLARRLDRECGTDEAARIRRAFLLTTGREPDATETASARRFLLAQRQAYAGGAAPEQSVWADFCQTLFGLNSFLYLE